MNEKALLFAAGLSIGMSWANGDPLNPLDYPWIASGSITTGSYVIDTDRLEMSGGILSTPLVGVLSTANGGRGTAVFTFQSQTIGPQVTITVKGSRAVAILSHSDLSIQGSIFVSGNNGSGGGTNSGVTPGGGGAHGAGAGSGLRGGDGGLGAFGDTNAPGAPGCAGSGNGAGDGGSAGTNQKGGGGAGGGFGGDGGNNAGSAYGNILARLEAGSGGGGGGGSSAGSLSSGGTGGSGGGAGGGAIELGAIQRVTITGTVVCNGGNGADGTSGFGSGGGGGGSGGAILIHARDVTLGTLFANGGAGGVGGGGGAGGAAGSGGAGGGGRITIQASNMPNLSNVHADGASQGVIQLVHSAWSAETVDFGEVQLYGLKVLPIVVRNVGEGGTTIHGTFGDLGNSLHFFKWGTDQISGLKPLQSASCEYAFTPLQLGDIQKNVVIVTNAGNKQITLKGKGIPFDCPADLNKNGFVDDADFQIFVAGYNALLCP